MKARRIRSGSENPTARAIFSMGSSVVSSWTRAASARAQPLDGLRRGLPRLGEERPAELAGTQARLPREPLHAQGLMQMLAGEDQGMADPIGRGLELQQRRELRLPSRPPMVDHQLPRHGARGLDSEILLDQHGLALRTSSFKLGVQVRLCCEEASCLEKTT
jgi:hypothetical protein